MGNLYGKTSRRYWREKYDETATAIIALLKYGNGFPFYRLAQLQKNLGVPVPASTQWGLLKNASPSAKPAYVEMLKQAAQGDLFHSDDTTAKVLSLMKEGQTENGRKGIFTTGILSKWKIGWPSFILPEEIIVVKTWTICSKEDFRGSAHLS